MWAVLADFDGTIMREDLAEVALWRFAPPEWERYNELLAEGKVNVEQSVRKEYAMIVSHSRREIIDYLRGYYRLRPGFTGLLHECRARDIEFAIVSAGLDFCIKDSFKVLGIPLPHLICPRSSFNQRGGISLTFPRVRSKGSRDFKEDAVSWYRKRGYSVAYVGDGAGDVHAAESADQLFTIRGSTLEKMCRARGLPQRAITTFAPISGFLETLSR